MDMKKISTDTIIRSVAMFVALVNQILTMFGKNPLPFAEEEIYEVITIFATVATTVWAWWRNNSFTTEAIKADKYLTSLKTDEYQGKRYR